jgi:PAS domain S-box-containing protein
MRFNFFRKRKKPLTSSGDLYESLVKFLTLQLSSPTDAESLINEAKDFLNLSEGKKQKEVVRIYLLFLQYCTKLDKVKKTSESSFAKKTIDRFPSLLDNKIARIPFKKEEEAKILLGAFFLNQILKPIREIAGARKGNIIDSYNNFIDQLWNEDYQAEIQISQFQLDGATVAYEDLVILSKLIHTDLSKRFGAPNIDNLYQRAYSRCESLLRDYRLFPQIIELMPVKILKQEHLKILGRGQIHKILIDQVSNLEDLNQKLVSEIEENKNLTDVLQYRTETLESILRNSLDCVIRINEKSEVTYWNQKSVEIFKYSEKEAIGKPLSDLIVPDMHKENHRRGMQRYLTTGKSKILNKTIEIEACDKEGKHFPVEISISEVREKGERSFISFLRDISQRKNYETTLIEAKNQAEETSRFKSRFFANMSHEIRTPLNAIIGFTNLLLDQDINEEQKEYLGLIQTSGKNLMTILNDVLEISKIEEGKLQLNPKAEDFKSTIREILSPYQAIAGEKDLSFEIEFEKNFPKTISVDYYRLSQVLVNLISNATKFTQKGGIRVYFQYSFNSSNEISIRTTVSDSGKGIDSENLNKIFESFQQEDGSIARQFGGTGLGLSISKEIASVMGGTLTAESPSTYFKDEGSDFIVEVNASIEIKRAAPLLEDKKPLKQSIELNALLVEDNPVNQKLLSTVLERMGLQISTANNGLEALEILNSKKFDIIFMDIQMPEMDGYTATEEIRKRQINTPIIAISANVYAEDIKKSLDSGMQAHVGKPFNTEELHTIITKLTSS